MSRQIPELQPKSAQSALLTVSPGTRRLLDCLACWWEGASLRQIARKHRISHTRVRTILNQVGCDQVARAAERGRPAFRRGAPDGRVKQALAMLEHRRRLTRRQRSVVAWTALGLASRQIAGRLGVTPQCVRNAFTAACFKLVPPQPEAERMAENNPMPMPALCWEGLDESLAGQMPEETDHAD